MSFGCNVLLLCHDRSKAVGGVRRFLCRNWVKFWTHFFCITGCFIFLTYEYVSLEQVNFYEEYLGTIEE